MNEICYRLHILSPNGDETYPEIEFRTSILPRIGECLKITETPISGQYIVRKITHCVGECQEKNEVVVEAELFQQSSNVFLSELKERINFTRKNAENSFLQKTRMMWATFGFIFAIVFWMIKMAENVNEIGASTAIFTIAISIFFLSFQLLWIARGNQPFETDIKLLLILNAVKIPLPEVRKEILKFTDNKIEYKNCLDLTVIVPMLIGFAIGFVIGRLLLF